MPTDATTPEEYRQRALLFADLGRYHEAAEEIAAGLTASPGEPALLTTLARVHLAADQPAEALVAADRAVAAAPATIQPLVVRAMALADTRQFPDAAQVAREILRSWADDPYAQRTGAALLSESRNGQEALNAAWHGVRIAPGDAEAHLVLAVVAARLRLFDLAQRAYSEALDLEPGIGAAQNEPGIVRLERRRWSVALEALADEASLTSGEPAVADPSAVADPPAPGAYPEPFPRPYPKPEAADTAAADGPPEVRPDPGPQPALHFSRPERPILDSSAADVGAIRLAVLYAANATLVATLVAAAMTLASGGISRAWAGVISVLILPAVLVWLRRQLIQPLAAALRRLRRRTLRVAVWLTAAAPVLLLLYAVIGGPVPLVAAVALAAGAEILALGQRQDHA